MALVSQRRGTDNLAAVSFDITGKTGYRTTMSINIIGDNILPAHLHITGKFRLMQQTRQS